VWEKSPLPLIPTSWFPHPRPGKNKHLKSESDMLSVRGRDNLSYKGNNSALFPLPHTYRRSPQYFLVSKNYPQGNSMPIFFGHLAKNTRDLIHFEISVLRSVS
jgi:hypothetical protein